jgi:hypothetical protein
VTLPRTKLGSRRIIHDGKGTDIIPLLCAQRSARIEANVWWPDHQGLKKKASTIRAQFFLKTGI